MLVLAAFVSISVAAILFLLRFLFAFFPAARRVPGRVEQVPAAHALGRSRVRTLDPGFTLVDFNSARNVVYAPSLAACSGVPREQFSGKGV